MHPLQQAIPLRKSRRSYLVTAISDSDFEKLGSLVQKYNKESGLTMEVVKDAANAFAGLRKSYGMFKNVRTLLVMKGKEDDIDLLEKCGFYGEHIVLEVVLMGLGTCWVGGTFDRSNPVLNIQANEKLVCVVTIGNTTEESSLKEKLLRNMSHGKTKPLEHFYTSDTTPPAWFMEGIQAVQVAPSAVNRQNYLFTYKNNTAEASTDHSRPSDMIDLGIAKAHFVIAAGGTFEWGTPAQYQEK